MIRMAVYILMALAAVALMACYYRRKRQELEREKNILLVQQEALREQYENLREAVRLSEGYREEIAMIMKESGLYDEADMPAETSNTGEPSRKDENTAADGTSMETAGTATAGMCDIAAGESTAETQGTDAAADPQESISAAEEIHVCENIMIQAVLQHKVLECRRKKIPLQLAMNGVDAITVDDVDLVGIFYNLFDNAIEACMRLPDPEDRFIKVSSEQQKRSWHLRMENACPPVAGRPSLFSTWKQDKEKHGIGLSVIRDLVRENRGRVETEQTGGTFLVDITLPAGKGISDGRLPGES